MASWWEARWCERRPMALRQRCDSCRTCAGEWMGRSLERVLQAYTTVLVTVGTAVLGMTLLVAVHWRSAVIGIAVVAVAVGVLRTLQIPLTKYSALGLIS